MGWWRRDPSKPCGTAREFGDEFRAEVTRLGGGHWSWDPHLREWLGDVLMAHRFGSPEFDWSPKAARHLAAEFMDEASQW